MTFTGFALHLSLVFFIALPCAAQKTDAVFKIRGNIDGVRDGLVSIISDDEQVLYSAKINNGHFAMSGTLDEVKQYLFRITPGNWNFKAFVENGESEINIDTAGAERYGKIINDPNSWALIWHIEQCCTPMATDYKNFLEETHNKQYGSQIKQEYNNLNNAKRNHDSLGIQEYLTRIDSLQNHAFTLQQQWVDHFISTKPQSPSGPFLLFTILQQAAAPTWKYYDERMQQFKDAALQSYYYRQLEQKLVALSNQVEGATAEDFKLMQPNGNVFSLSSLRGKYVLLDFWASWCGPCRKEIPHWKTVYRQYQQRGFEIVAISVDRNYKDWRKALKQEQMPWIQVVDSFPSPGQSGYVSDLFGIRLIPHYILLDKDGKVLLGTGNSEAIREKIRSLIK
jgi:thiol-disulfide isomerase/thioredoxin